VWHTLPDHGKQGQKMKTLDGRLNEEPELSDEGLVAFGNSRNIHDVPSTVRYLIIPSKDNWNDFGLRVRADIGLRCEDPNFHWMKGFFAIKDEPNTQSALQELLEKRHQKSLFPGDIKKPFLTMFQDTEGYRMAVQILGQPFAQTAAAMVNDAAYLQYSGTCPEGWSDYARSEVFNQAFLRGTETGFAYDHGGTLLAGGSLDSRDARHNFEVAIKTRDGTLEYAFAFEAGNLTDNRIAILIGPNGTGKTYSLIRINKALLGAKSSGLSAIQLMPKFNQLLVFANTRSLARFRLGREHPNIASQKIFDLGVAKQRGAELTSLFIKVLRRADYNPGSIRILQKVLEEDFHETQLLVPVSDTQLRDSTSYEPLELFLRASEQAKLERAGRIDDRRPLHFAAHGVPNRGLSQGQDTFLTFLFRALANCGPASLFLIDEPENFLHPTLISRFVRLLNSILKETNSIALVATHSPFVVRELSRTQVHVLQWNAESKLVQVQKPILQTLGANIGAVSDHIFNDDLSEHLYVETLKRSKYASLPIEKALEDLKEELSLDALMKLREIHEKRAGQAEEDDLEIGD
jgi:ABC-type multidrug transport system ATPase subunit